MPSVAVIVLNWNGISDTLSCLNSLQKQSYRDYKIVIVDNNSLRDDSIDQLRQLEAPDVVTIFNDQNLGFSGGVNTGIRWAMDNKFDYVALFNNDAKADNKWLASLVSAADNHNADIVTGLLLHADGATIDSTGDFYSIWGIPSPRLRNRPTKEAPTSGFVFAGSGGATLYSLKLLKDIGMLDEDFFMYYEDVDISFRAQLSGYKVYYESKAIAYHKQGAASSKRPGLTIYQAFKNLPLLFIKNVPRGLLIPIGVRFYFLYLLMILNAVRRGDGSPALKGVAMSVILFWRSTLWKRFQIQKRKVVTTSYIHTIISHELPPESSLRKLPWMKKGRT